MFTRLASLPSRTLSRALSAAVCIEHCNFNLVLWADSSRFPMHELGNFNFAAVVRASALCHFSHALQAEADLYKTALFELHGELGGKVRFAMIDWLVLPQRDWRFSCCCDGLRHGVWRRWCRLRAIPAPYNTRKVYYKVICTRVLMTARLCLTLATWVKFAGMARTR